MIASYPDVIVLFTDINMPGSMDGLALAQRVHDNRPEIQLIITSGRGRPDDRDIPNGGHFIAKPYSEHAIIDLVTTAHAKGR